MENKPLVSVIVLSYNSSDTITETLDSIYAQDYKNIELVVSDDCSPDNTVEVATEWISSHKERFYDCKINARKENGGVPKNLNSGIRICEGKYIKIIAADDLLTEDCISVNVRVCLENGYRHLCTWLRKFSVKENGDKEIWDVEYNCPSNDMTAAEQYNHLLSGNTIFGCIFFTEKSFIEEMGMYNEDYPLLEDYPMWVKITRQGIKLNLINIPTVLYRISDTSLSNFVGDRVVNPRYVNCIDGFIKKEVIPPLLKQRKIKSAIRHIRYIFYHRLFILLGNSRKKRIVRFFEYFYEYKHLKCKLFRNKWVRKILGKDRKK